MKRIQPCYALVPVKVLDAAKSRLSPLLSKNERRQLSIKMLEDVLSAIGATRGIYETIVLSKDSQVPQVAKRFQTSVLRESQSGLNQAISEATDWCVGNAAKSVLILPADVPLVSSQDVDKMLAFGLAASIVACPSKAGSGTNALLLNPPRVVPVFYGKDSFQHYIKEASKRGLHLRIYRSPRLALDIDTINDVIDFVASKAENTRAYHYLMEIEILKRLEHRRKEL